MIIEIFRTVSIWVIVLPFLAGVINYRNLNRDSKWMFYLVVAGLAPQILTSIINRSTPALNISYNLYTPVEFVLMYAIFFNKYSNGINRKIVRVSAFCYWPIAVFLFWQKGITTVFVNELVCINSVFYMIWILLFLKEQFNAHDILIGKGNPFSWYLLAILIYAPCSIIAFALYHYIREKENGALSNLWVIQSVCNILMYLLLMMGLFIRKQKMV
ncbi:MAG: hypothetical protein EOO04_25625 [Chitinophagaceae bacterium]|nr:MAG: hypothetical protein EOO04_25625 [Chitinophagaceae bacterium]